MPARDATDAEYQDSTRSRSRRELWIFPAGTVKTTQLRLRLVVGVATEIGALAAAASYIAAHQWFGRNDLPAMATWSLPLALATSWLLAALAPRLSRGGTAMAFITCVAVGAIAGVIWSVVVAVILGPWIAAFSFPVLMSWTAGGLLGETDDNSASPIMSRVDRVSVIVRLPMSSPAPSANRRPPRAPLAQRLHHGSELATGGGERILRSRRMIGIEPSFDEPVLLELLQARRQRVRTRADERFLKILESARTVEKQVAQHEDRPPIPDDVERAHHGTEFRIANRHFIYCRREWLSIG